MNSIVSILVKIDGKDTKLTVNQAKELRDTLNEVFPVIPRLFEPLPFISAPFPEEPPFKATGPWPYSIRYGDNITKNSGEA